MLPGSRGETQIDTEEADVILPEMGRRQAVSQSGKALYQGAFSSASRWAVLYPPDRQILHYIYMETSLRFQQYDEAFPKNTAIFSRVPEFER